MVAVGRLLLIPVVLRSVSVVVLAVVLLWWLLGWFLLGVVGLFLFLFCSFSLLCGLQVPGVLCAAVEEISLQGSPEGQPQRARIP